MPKIPPEQIEQARSVDLLTYLQTHEPHSIRKSGANEYCLDNDNAGKTANNRIIGELLRDKRYAHLKISVVPPPIGKDYNDTLKAILQLNKEKSVENRPSKAVFSI